MANKHASLGVVLQVFLLIIGIVGVLFMACWLQLLDTQLPGAGSAIAFIIALAIIFVFAVIAEMDGRENKRLWENELARYREHERRMQTDFNYFKHHFVPYSTDDTPERAWERLRGEGK